MAPVPIPAITSPLPVKLASFAIMRGLVRRGPPTASTRGPSPADFALLVGERVADFIIRRVSSDFSRLIAVGEVPRLPSPPCRATLRQCCQFPVPCVVLRLRGCSANDLRDRVVGEFQRFFSVQSRLTSASLTRTWFRDLRLFPVPVAIRRYFMRSCRAFGTV